LYTGTVLAQHHLTPAQVVWLVRGIWEGETTAALSRELGVGYAAVLSLRHELQAHAEQLQPKDALPDTETESDEMFQNAREKGRPHRDPTDRPRRRANKRRGRGTQANDRPPIVGVVGRNTGQVRVRVKPDTQAKTLCGPVHSCTRLGSGLYTDESDSYAPILRPQAAVCHSRQEWTRDDDGDGIRKVHTNTLQGGWSGLPTFLRPFRGVHKHYLGGYVAPYQFGVNLKRISTSFIAPLVSLHTFTK
jgi:hypothetical protein